MIKYAYIDLDQNLMLIQKFNVDNTYIIIV